MGPKKLVLAVIDALKPSILERAAASGQAPFLGRLLAEGSYTPECVSVFPSVTPVCAATIATGAWPQEHRIPSINWYSRDERRYIEYGSSFKATRTFGIARSLTDTVYNLNTTHLPAELPTCFELLDDHGVRTAGTTYLIYRGRHRHEVSKQTVLSRIATSTMFRRPVYGPRELFYADLFASRTTGCSSALGMPGRRDQHAGCVGEYMVRNDLFDFLLLSLPDNDTHSHRFGPEAQLQSVALADLQLQRLAVPAGGIDAFLEEHAVVVMADHSQSPITARIDLCELFSEWNYLRPNDASPGEAEIALSPGARSALIYVLDLERRDDLLPRLRAHLAAIDGIDLIIWRTGDEATLWSSRGELRFAAGGELCDERGSSWALEGDLATLGATVQDGRITTPDYPLAFERLWSALHSPTTGDLLISAAPGYEFVDWGGDDHLGGGSHGSLHSCDSLAPLICCGTGPDNFDERPVWTIADAMPIVSEHFGVGM